MPAIQVALNRAMRLAGALGVALVDYVSRMSLGVQSLSNGLGLDRVAHHSADVVRAHLEALDLIGRKPHHLEDILITLDGEYHLLRPLTRRTHEGLFLLLVLDPSAPIRRRHARSSAASGNCYENAGAPGP